MHKTRAAAVVGLAIPLWLSASAVAGAASAGLVPVPPLPVVVPVGVPLPAPVASLIGASPASSPTGSPATGSPGNGAPPAASPSPTDMPDPLGQILTLVAGTAASLVPVPPSPSPTASQVPPPPDPVIATASSGSTVTSETPRTPDVAALVTKHVKLVVKQGPAHPVAARPRPARPSPTPTAAVPQPEEAGFLPQLSIGSATDLIVAAPQVAGPAALPDTDTPEAVLATRAVVVAQARVRVTNQVSTGLAAVALIGVVAAAGAQVPARRRLRR